jgi:hypothetical protein
VRTVYVHSCTVNGLILNFGTVLKVTHLFLSSVLLDVYMHIVDRSIQKNDSVGVMCGRIALGPGQENSRRLPTTPPHIRKRPPHVALYITSRMLSIMG